jgi:hypothetical protein
MIEIVHPKLIIAYAVLFQQKDGCNLSEALYS